MTDISNDNVKVPIKTLGDMIFRVGKYLLKEDKKPKNITVRVGETVTFAKLKDMSSRVDTYITNHPGQPINYVWTTKPTQTVAQPIAQPTTVRDLRLGMSGSDVTAWQKSMQAIGFYSGYKTDGSFGQKTEEATKTFQSRACIVVDGVVGPQTRDAMAHWGSVKPGVIQGDMAVLLHIEKKFGVDLKTKEQFYDLLKAHGVYKFYYNQKYSQESSMNYAFSIGINCADWVNDIVAPVLRALGYNPRVVHCQVKCLDGKWYGHYIVIVDNIIFDGTAAAKHKYNLGNCICTSGYSYSHDESGGRVPT